MMRERMRTIAKGAAICFIGLVLTGIGSATDGSLLKVTLDIGPSPGEPTTLGWQVIPNSTVTIGAGNFFKIYVWRTTAGSAPWTFKLTTPAGNTFQQSTSFANTWLEWDWRFDLGAVNPIGVWTAQIDDGPTLSWTLAYPIAPRLTALSTTPNPPVAGKQFVLTVTGTGFDPTRSGIGVSGPGCFGGCSVANSALTIKTSNTLSGPITVPQPGSYTAAVGGSNTIPFVVNELVPTATAVSNLPSPPVARQFLTLTVGGADFIPSTAQIVVAGPGCSPCASSTLSAWTSNTVASLFSFDNSGTFMVAVRNGTNGTQSNAVPLIVQSTTPSIVSAGTSPSPAVAGQPFQLRISGYPFEPLTVFVTVTGPGCSPCVIPNGSLTIQQTMLSGPLTVTSPGTFTVVVRNGAGGNPSSTLSFSVSGSTPTISALSTSPSPPATGRPFTLTVTGAYFDPLTAALLVTNGVSCNPCTIANNALTTRTRSRRASRHSHAKQHRGLLCHSPKRGRWHAIQQSLHFRSPLSHRRSPGRVRVASPAVAMQQFGLTVTGTDFNLHSDARPD